MGRKSGSGSGIWHEQAGSYFLEWVKKLKFFDAYPGYGFWDGKN
jgi:hypothetical protein